MEEKDRAEKAEEKDEDKVEEASDDSDAKDEKANEDFEEVITPEGDDDMGGDAADDVRPMTPPCVNAMLLVCSVFDLVLTQLRSAYPAAGD